jgi:hypothetical protein
LFIDENDNRTTCSNIDNNSIKSRARWNDDPITSDSDMNDLKSDENLLGDGSDEDDSLLVIYQDSPGVYLT